MGEDLVLQTNGPYLRIVLPDFEPDWAAVWKRVDFELAEGIQRAEIVTPCYPDDDCVEGVRDLVEKLERRGVQTIVEWQGIPPSVERGSKPVPV